MKGIFCFLVIFCVVFSGCVAGKTVLKDAPMVASDSEEFDLALRPHESLGIKLTPAIKAGRVTVFKRFAISKKIFYAEEYPGRIRWNGWLVTPSGLEYFVQIIRTSINRKGEYEYKAIVDGTPEEIAGGRIVGMSSKLDFLMDFKGRDIEITEARADFAKNRKTRASFAMTIGTPVEQLIIDKSDFIGQVKKLNRYTLQKEGYEIACEYVEKDFRKINILISGDGALEKFVLYGKSELSIPIIPEPTTIMIGVGTSIGMAMIDFMLSQKGISKGWDYWSAPQTNEVAAFKQMWLDKLREQHLAMLNQKIADYEKQLPTEERRR